MNKSNEGLKQMLEYNIHIFESVNNYTYPGWKTQFFMYNVILVDTIMVQIGLNSRGLTNEPCGENP